MTWGESRARRRWQRELEAQIRALPTSQEDTPDGGPVAPLGRRPEPASHHDSVIDGRERLPGERSRTILTVGLTLAAIIAVLGLSATTAADAIRGLVGWEGDRGDELTYEFLNTRRGTDEPVTWPSCRPIRYVVNPAGAPDRWETTLEDAMDAVTEASGLEFADEGITDDAASEPRRDPFGRAKPVLIAWATPAEVPALDGDTVGIGGPERTGRSYDSGGVTLDAEAFARKEREGAKGAQRAIVVPSSATSSGSTTSTTSGSRCFPPPRGRRPSATATSRACAASGAVPASEPGFAIDYGQPCLSLGRDLPCIATSPPS